MKTQIALAWQPRISYSTDEPPWLGKVFAGFSASPAGPDLHLYGPQAPSGGCSGGGRPRAGPGPAAGRPHYRFWHDIGVPRRTVREPPQALGTCGPERPAGKDAASDRPRPAACGRRARHGHHDGISLVKGGGCHSGGTPCALSVDVLRVLRSRPAQQASPGFSWLPRLSPQVHTTAVVDPSTTYLRYRRYYGTLGGTH